MASIAPDTIYTKTAKGILEVKNKSVKLPREIGLIFLSVDGRASIADLQPRSRLTPAQFQHALNSLVTDGYIKVVTHGGAQAPADHGQVDFTQQQAIATVNAEAASHALAAADAAKRAQSEAKAALEARARQEAEARARVLAETRAAAEAEARAKAEASARAAAEERANAERDAAGASDTPARAEAEARVRAAAAALVRAEAEARVRAEAEERARAQAQEKRGAEEEAAKEAESHTKAEEQAQARAAAEGRAKELLEAQLHAMETLRAAGDPTAPEAEGVRAQLRRIENEAERAREAVREIAEAEGRANEVPQPEMDIAERVRQLHARVAAERQSREAPKPDPLAVEFEAQQPAHEAGSTWSALELDTTATAEKPSDDLPVVMVPSDDEPARTPAPQAASAAPSSEATPLPVVQLPVVDLDRADVSPPASPEHVPTALERTMAQVAARQQKRMKDEAPPEKPAKDPAAATQPIILPPVKELTATGEPDETAAPTIDTDEPIIDRLNVDRATHDIITETVEARRKAEATQLTHAAAEARRKRADEEARRAAAAEREKSRTRLLRNGNVAAIALPALGVAWLQFATLDGYIPDAQRALSLRLNQPVAIQRLRYVLLPTPRLVLEDVWIGKGQGIKVKRVQAGVGPLAALAGPESFDTVEAAGVEIDPAVFATIPKWTGGRPADTIHVNTLRLTDLRLNMPGESLGSFDGTVAFAANGTVKEAAFQNEKLHLTLTPSPEGVRVALDATAWRIPYGPPIEFDRLKVSGLVDQQQVAAGEFTGTLASGTLEGAVTARWSGLVAIQGEFKLQNARVLDLTRALTPNFTGRGTLRANGRFSMQGADWSTVRANPQVESSFAISRGELTNIDLVRAIQSAAPGAIRGGRTAFEELSGVMHISGERVAFRRLQMSSGALNASGTVDIGAGSQLNGRFSAQLSSGAGSVVARSSLGVTGTVADPSLTR